MNPPHNVKPNNRSPLASIVGYCGIVPKLAASVFLADGARVIGNVSLQHNCSVWFNAVVRGDVNSIVIGANTNIQDNAIVHGTYGKFSTTIGKNVSIGHLAIVHGCIVEEGCLIGMGATIMDGAVVGKESIIGAGSIVTQGLKIPPRSLALGAPAKVIRQVTDKEYESILATTYRYIEYANGYNFNSGVA